MIQADSINQWLEEPQLLSEQERYMVDALLKKYPYFVAGHYLKAFLDNKITGKRQHVAATMALYKGNWALYENLLQKAITGKNLWKDDADNAAASVEIPAAAVTNAAPETVINPVIAAEAENPPPAAEWKEDAELATTAQLPAEPEGAPNVATNEVDAATLPIDETYEAPVADNITGTSDDVLMGQFLKEHSLEQGVTGTEDLATAAPEQPVIAQPEALAFVPVRSPWDHEEETEELAAPEETSTVNESIAATETDELPEPSGELPEEQLNSTEETETIETVFAEMPQPEDADEALPVGAAVNTDNFLHESPNAGEAVLTNEPQPGELVADEVADNDSPDESGYLESANTLAEAGNAEEATPQEEIAAVEEHLPEMYSVEQSQITEDFIADYAATAPQNAEPLFTLPVDDYFTQQGISVADNLPLQEDNNTLEDKSLLVMMSYSEWLNFFQKKTIEAREEEEGKKALKTMWQQEKLAAALGEEQDEIPENVFEMAVNSLAKEEGLVSEPLAEILIKQGKHDKALEMFHKLKLRNPQKSTYFAARIAEIKKDIAS